MLSQELDGEILPGVLQSPHTKPRHPPPHLSHPWASASAPAPAQPTRMCGHQHPHLPQHTGSAPIGPLTPDTFLSKPLAATPRPWSPLSHTLAPRPCSPETQDQALPPPSTEAQRPHLHSVSAQPRAVFSTNTGLFQKCARPPPGTWTTGLTPGIRPLTPTPAPGAGWLSTGHGGSCPAGVRSGGRTTLPTPPLCRPRAWPTHQPLHPPPSA